ncbi:helix-turn-helix domain-containing protein [Marinactinospora thermotolerans]|uniref:helix-turn-helix domain-containing protein n=1 Tax=Marinactinospora thermotolerans TaxID=531310 RepID=UPI003D92D2D8
MTGDISTFGSELRRLRNVAGWTLGDLAVAVHYSKSHLSKVENGHKAPSVTFARACDNALGAKGGLAALVPAPARAGVAAGSRPLPASGSPSLPTGFPPASGQGAFDIGSAALLGLSPAGAHREPPLRSPRVLDTFSALFDQLRLLGQRTGPALVLPSVLAQTHALTQLARNAEPELRVEALFLASRYAEYGGWMAQESGDDRAALWWTDQAVQMATAAGDHELHSYALIRRACVTMYAHDGLQTVELAQRARSEAVSARVRALAAEREAQGHALLGDHDDCMRALDLAASLADGGGTTAPGRPPLGTSSVEDRLPLVTGWCLYDLGLAAEAAATLDSALAGVPEGAVRARARFGARRALAHASAGNVDQACALATDLLDEVGMVDSATIAHDLRQLARTLTRWHGDPAVRDLSPRLALALRRQPL